MKNNFLNLLNGLDRLREYYFFIEKDQRHYYEIWNRYFDKVIKISYNINKIIYSSGLEWNDYLFITTISLHNSIYAYDLSFNIPLIAFIIVRLKSDIYKQVRIHLKKGHKALNQAIIVDWQEESYKQPKTNNPTKEYFNDYIEKVYIDTIKKTKSLTKKEKEVIFEKLNNSKYTRKKINKHLTKKEIQKKDNLYQKGKKKLIKLVD